MTQSDSTQVTVKLKGLKQFVGDVSIGTDISVQLPIPPSLSSKNCKTVERDCELLLQKLRQHPKEMTTIFNCVAKSDLKQAVQIAQKIGCTEAEFKNAGGGLLALVGAAVGLAIVLWASDAW